jgi:hypothetical protein
VHREASIIHGGGVGSELLGCCDTTRCCVDGESSARGETVFEGRATSAPSASREILAL